MNLTQNYSMTVEFKNLKNFSILVQDFTKFNIRVILNDLGKHQFYNKTAMSYSSVWPDDYITFSIFGHLQQSKLAQLQQKFAKFCQKLNRPFKIAKVFQNFAKVAKHHQIWSHCCCCCTQFRNPFCFTTPPLKRDKEKKEFNRLGIPTAGKKYAKGVRNSITQLTLLMMTEWKNLNIQKGSSILKSFLQMFFCQKRI